MKLKLYRAVPFEAAVLIMELTADDSRGPQHVDLPVVRRGDGSVLEPEDGEEYLEALHGELGRGAVVYSVQED